MGYFNSQTGYYIGYTKEGWMEFTSFKEYQEYMEAHEDETE